MAFDDLGKSVDDPNSNDESRAKALLKVVETVTEVLMGLENGLLKRLGIDGGSNKSDVDTVLRVFMPLIEQVMRHALDNPELKSGISRVIGTEAWKEAVRGGNDGNRIDGDAYAQTFKMTFIGGVDQWMREEFSQRP